MIKPRRCALLPRDSMKRACDPFFSVLTGLLTPTPPSVSDQESVCPDNRDGAREREREEVARDKERGERRVLFGGKGATTADVNHSTTSS